VDKEIVAAGGFVLLFVLMLLRVPIGISMGIAGFVGFSAAVGLGPALGILTNSPISTATDYAYGLVPLFILMGAFATRSGMSQELFTAAAAWMGHRRGGLALASIGACGGFSAICGSSVATAATMARIAVPEMRRLKYHGGISCGVVAAGGTLGILIPPSLGLALYGIIVEQNITELFMAGVLPGLLAVVMYMLTIQLIAWFDPASLPAGPRVAWRERFSALRGVWAVLVLFLFVMAGLYVGVFTPTEGAGMGAAGALIIAVLRRRLPWREFMGALTETVKLTGAIFMILIGALPFGYFLAVTQVPQAITEFIGGVGLGAYGVLALILVFYLILGCLLDVVSMIILTLPLVFPLVREVGFDPIWFGVIIVMVMELGLITPPVGLNVFVINAVVRDVPLGAIFRGVAPFILTDIVRLGLLIAFPIIVVFLPRTMH
jgi:C4-dicarboxylate transporter, DctM subunit